MTETVRESMTTASAAYRRFAERASPTERERPTRLAGWTVGDLIDHVTWAAGMEAAAVRLAHGVPTAAPSSLEQAVAGFEHAATLEVDAAMPITLPAGTVPFAYAAPLFAFEAALHAWDLDVALGMDQPTLTDEELAACAIVLGPMLDLVAATTPGSDVVIDLVGLGKGVRLSVADGGWQRGVPDERRTSTTVTGNPSDIVLFACGRIEADDLDVQGDRLHAERFKTYFPGP